MHLQLRRSWRVIVTVMALAVLQASAKGQPAPSTEFDLVVYGGTAGGVITAVTAAREGLRVALIEPGTHLGGMMSGGLGWTDHGVKETIGGYALEFFQRVGKRYGEPLTWYFEPHAAEAVFNDLVKEAGVQLFLQHRLREKTGVAKSGARIDTITIERVGGAPRSDGRASSSSNTARTGLTGGQPITLRARLFADAGYEGDLMAQARVTYAWGREGEAEFGESLAGVRGHTPKHQFLVRVDPRDAGGTLLPEISAAPKGEPGAADRRVQAYNFRVCMTDRADNRVPFPKPAQYDATRYELLARMLAAMDTVKADAARQAAAAGGAVAQTTRISDPMDRVKQPWSLIDVMKPDRLKHGKTDTNNNGAFSTDYIGGSYDYPEGDYAARARIWQAHVDYVQGFLYFLAHDARVPRPLHDAMAPWGLCKDEFSDNGHWPYQLYVREARRMRGEYVMSQRDIQVELTKPDAIGMGSYNSDSHNVQRVATPDGTVENEGDMQVPVKPYQIPYRMILPKRSEASNLFVPVAFSATHVAYSTLRMEPQYMIIGQAAGVAAKLAIDGGTAVQDVDPARLIGRLRAQQAVLELKPRTPTAAAVPASVPASPPAAVPPPAQLPAAAPPSAATRWPDDRTLTFDPSFTIATLRNGLTYYVRHHDQPAKRVVLRLIVKTGSLHEEERERGYAHFVEHMAFNGTRHFRPGQLVTFFEERGARFGAHVNAQTSFDTTTYFLTVPSDRPELLDKGLLALADFAGAVSFDRREVDRERPIIVEEWRQRQGLGTRVQNRQMPVLYHGSRYVDRVPIGTRESIAAATPDALRRFHQTWYRPDRMAVVVIGDIDAARARTLIDKHFSGLKARTPARPDPDSRVPLHPDLLVSVVTDPELTSSAATILRKTLSTPKADVATVRRGQVQGLVAQMLNARLGEITRRPDSPFLSASFTAMGVGRQMDAVGFSVRTRDGELTKGLEAALVEGRRVREHGYAQTELGRAKDAVRARIESGFKDKDKTQSATLASSCQSHFLDGIPLASPEDGLDLSLDVLSRITLDEVTKEARVLLEDPPSVLLVTAPEKADLAAPKEPDLREALARAKTPAVAAYEDTPVGRGLMETKPTPGRVTASRTIAPLGVTVLTMGNGIEAWLKPTDFRQEQITFSLQGLGGTAMAEPAAHVEATLATAYVRTAGVGGLSATALGKVLAGKLGGASPSIGLNTTGVSGGSTPAFLETALQLLYLSVTAPNDDTPALAVLKRQLTASLTNRQQSPQAMFADRLSAINLMGHYTTEVPTIARIERLEIAPLLAFYRERFARARDVRFFMVGAFDVAAVTPLLEQYVGALPMGGAADAGPAALLPALDVRFPESIVKERVVKGRESGARTVLTFPAQSTRDVEKMSAEGAAVSVLQSRLRERLREQLGQTYSVSVGRSPSMQPFSRFGTVSVSFGSAAENIDSLAAAVLHEVDGLRREGPTDAEVRTYQEQERRSLETGLKQNGYWLGGLQAMLLLGRDPLELLEREAQIAGITRAGVRDAAGRLFPAQRYTVVSLVPEP